MNILEQLVNGTRVKYAEESKYKVFVCGGYNKVNKEFYSDAYEIGKMLAKYNVAYINGASPINETIMGESYKGYKENGGDSSYFISRAFCVDDMKDEIKYLKGAYIVDDIGSLLRAQFLWSDLLVIAPGGIGTFMEMLGLIDFSNDYPTSAPKAIIYNKKTDGKGFFDNILEQIKVAKNFGFSSDDVINEKFIIVDNLKDLDKELGNIINNQV